MRNSKARRVAAVALTAWLSGCSAAPTPPPSPSPRVTSTSPGAGQARPGPARPAPTRPGPAGRPTAARPGPVAGSGGGRYGIPAFPPAPAPRRITLEPGPAVPYLKRIPTTQRVAFLTIDDGFLKLPEGPRLVAAAHVPVTLFLTTDAIKDNPGYFRPMIAAGAVVEAHSISHANLRGRPYAFQRREICGSADRLRSWYGRRPTLFRPPFGNHDATTLRAARDCGMTAALMWKETVDKGIVRYQEGHQVKPGDILLMHFRPSFEADFVAALRAIRSAGLTPARLEDYLPR